MRKLKYNREVRLIEIKVQELSRNKVIQKLVNKVT